MRQIKFRAWHTGKKKMFSCSEMVEDQLAMLPDGRFALSISDVDPRLSRIDEEGVIIPLQYTGLKDSEGVEIYEGDILRDEDDSLSEVTLVGACFCSRYQVDQRDISAPLLFPERFQVIGNVHESPELIEGEG